ncbi:hypothetical protein O181_093801 [Austropuccinia psidii MF-1]|uniref:Uncharacterized protein n=1 Tax=Austropuccinia psidii MF-1 TaxID=1389203 RepID=A0A9Q3J271_9BASI|nr:hypothetical protein [Austropuccinia psidii MF-1]
MSLKAKAHINTIGKVQVITPHGAKQHFGMLIFVNEMTSTPLPDHLTPFQCLLSHMSLLPRPLLCLCSHTALKIWLCGFPTPAAHHANSPASPSRHSSNATLTHPYAHIVPSIYASNAALTPPYTSSHPLPSLCSHSALKICLKCHPHPSLHFLPPA